MSLREDKPLVFVGTKRIPGLEVSQTADTCSLARCRGGCRYCFCALTVKSDQPEDQHFIRSAIGETRMKLLIRAINITKPDVITTAEKIELGFCQEAVEEVRALRNGVRSETFMVFTTKFPDVWKQLDMPNTGMLVTLSNPRNIAGLEPNILPYMKRMEGVFKAATTAKHLKVGVRLLIMQREDIEFFCKALTVLKPYLDPNLIWADFLRSPFVAKKGRFYKALRGYLDLSQFVTHQNHGPTLREDIMEEAVRAFAKYNVTFDRLPIGIRRGSLSSQIRVVDTCDRVKCYIRADGSECIRGAAGWQAHTCWGRLRPNYRGQGVVKWASKDGFCVNLLNMTCQQHENTHDLWHWVGEVKAFAYGRRSGPGNKTYNEVMKTLHDPVLVNATKNR